MLPANIASRHRICTNIASRVKELGFPGDCGYNQLLYPVEQQTRVLLHWLVQKLPRSREERVEESLGANAALNKRIIEKIASWKVSPFQSQICAKGTPPRNIYEIYGFQTTFFGEPWNLSTLVGLNQELRLKNSPSLLEINVLSSIAETSSHSVEDIFDTSRRDLRNSRPHVCRIAQNSMRSTAAHCNFEASLTQEFTSVSNEGLTFSGDCSDKNGLFSTSLQDLLDIIGLSGNVSEAERGTRFIHATKFSHQTAIVLDDWDRKNTSVHLAHSGSGSPNFKSIDESNALTTSKNDERTVTSSEEILEILRSEIQQDTTTLEARKREKNSLVLKVRQIEGDISTSSTESEILETDVMLKRKVLELLPSAAENIKKLQDICGASAKRLLELSHEWELHRRALLDRVRNPKGSKSERKLRCKIMVDEMKVFRELMQKMVSDLKDKQDYSQTLKDELEKLPRNINRNIYTFRIMDIISQVAKQNKEIEKIIGDIHDIQKAINQANSSLQRADTIAEEKIYAAANTPGSDPAMTDAYRHLRRLRSTFEQLVVTVEKIGQEDKAARGLETKIEQEQARVSANNFDRIQSDLEQIKSENNQLICRLKSNGAVSSNR
jgi:hypothetical protein